MTMSGRYRMHGLFSHPFNFSSDVGYSHCRCSTVACGNHGSDVASASDRYPLRRIARNIALGTNGPAGSPSIGSVVQLSSETEQVLPVAPDGMDAQSVNNNGQASSEIHVDSDTSSLTELELDSDDNVIENNTTGHLQPQTVTPRPISLTFIDLNSFGDTSGVPQSQPAEDQLNVVSNALRQNMEANASTDRFLSTLDKDIKDMLGHVIQHARSNPGHWTMQLRPATMADGIPEATGRAHLTNNGQGVAAAPNPTPVVVVEDTPHPESDDATSHVGNFPDGRDDDDGTSLPPTDPADIDSDMEDADASDADSVFTTGDPSESENEQENGVIVYDPFLQIQLAQENVCLLAFPHEGTAKFFHNPAHSDVGNIYPKFPQVGFRVQLIYRITASGDFNISANINRPFSQRPNVLKTRTVGWVKPRDCSRKTLRTLCGTKQHYIYGSITSVYQRNYFRRMITEFIVDWESGRRCSFV
ncbi:hypothetical protein BJ508DRAFT_306400 [Ascobolus immersus RN42]|uniref:Uncharacterized protein n=1 Tax=Ascobolus immersus RN42 TaxID=1160509 RepID=A0A3N4I674_ASCIM|nr:hypothetical protein BJ508DRAFT_306400 [Ascobolus immersus RN42]